MVLFLRMESFPPFGPLSDNNQLQYLQHSLRDQEY